MFYNMTVNMINARDIKSHEILELRPLSWFKAAVRATPGAESTLHSSH